MWSSDAQCHHRDVVRRARLAVGRVQGIQVYLRRAIAAPQGLKLRGGNAVMQAVCGHQIAVVRAARALPNVQPGFGVVVILVGIGACPNFCVNGSDFN